MSAVSWFVVSFVYVVVCGFVDNRIVDLNWDVSVL